MASTWAYSVVQNGPGLCPLDRAERGKCKQNRNTINYEHSKDTTG